MLAQTISLGLVAYGVIGMLFALAFVAWGAGAIDPVAKRSGLGFRLMILPGAVGLWPWLGLKWIAARRKPR